MRGSHRQTVAAVTTLMIILGMAAVAAPAAGATVPDHIVISPDPAVTTAGIAVTYSAEGFDASDVSLGDVTPDTTFSITGPGGCNLADCGSNVAGDYIVTGDDSAITATAMLHVDSAGLDHIVISPGSATITAGSSQTYSAAAFDAFDNALGDVTASTSFLIDPPGSCNLANCGSNVAGDYIVTGALSGSVSDTATLHVGANAPSITSFKPSSGAVRAAVVISGSNFTGATGVTFNGTPAPFHVNSDIKITATVPMGARAGKISVTAPGGTTDSGTKTFAVKPTITRFKRLSGRTGSRVVIRGSALSGATSVTFNRTRARFHVASYGRITAIVPERATTGRIRVKTPGGKAASSTGFKVKPRVTRFGPTAGRVGTSVVIRGSGFSKVWRVMFNGRETRFKVKSSRKIVAKVPDAKTGPIRVTTAYGTVKTAKTFHVV